MFIYSSSFLVNSTSSDSSTSHGIRWHQCWAASCFCMLVVHIFASLGCSPSPAFPSIPGQGAICLIMSMWCNGMHTSPLGDWTPGFNSQHGLTGPDWTVRLTGRSGHCLASLLLKPPQLVSLLHSSRRAGVLIGRFDLAALCGCRTLNFCLFVYRFVTFCRISSKQHACVFGSYMLQGYRRRLHKQNSRLLEFAAIIATDIRQCLTNTTPPAEWRPPS